MVGEANRLLASWNCDGHKIFTTTIEAFNLTSGQKSYTIGPGGDFDTARPVSIKAANFIFPGLPEIHIPIRILDDIGLSRVTMQDIPGAPPWYLYYDGSFNANGLANILIIGQPPSGYQLELYSWQSLNAGFTAATNVVLWPPGYAKAVSSSLALSCVNMNPVDSPVARNGLMLQALQREAMIDLDALITLNSQSPELYNEWANDSGDGSMNSGLIFAGGGSGTVEWVSPTTPPDGVISTFTFAFEPIECLFNGIYSFLGVSPGFRRGGTNQIYFVNSSGATIVPAITSIIKGRES